MCLQAAAPAHVTPRQLVTAAPDKGKAEEEKGGEQVKEGGEPIEIPAPLLNSWICEPWECNCPKSESREVGLLAEVIHINT